MAKVPNAVEILRKITTAEPPEWGARTLPTDRQTDGRQRSERERAPSPKIIVGPFLLCPNGWTHQDASWYRGRPQPRRLCVRWGPSSRTQKGGGALPIFGPSILWPNGWMHQDATWYGGRPQFRRLCVRWRPSPLPKRGRSPQFLAHVYCAWPNGWMDQVVTWYGGRPRHKQHCVTWGPGSPQKKAQLPNYRPMFIVDKRLYVSGYHLARK